MRQVGLVDFARAVDAGAQFLDPLAIDVEADHRGAGARERDRHRQADIAEPDHGNLALMRQNLNPLDLKCPPRRTLSLACAGARRQQRQCIVAHKTHRIIVKRRRRA